MPGQAGVVLGMRTFGMSAPMKVVAEHFGFTVDGVVAAARQAMAADGTSSLRRTAMELGMIGLGRMGANMVERLMKAGHQLRGL